MEIDWQVWKDREVSVWSLYGYWLTGLGPVGEFENPNLWKSLKNARCMSSF